MAAHRRRSLWALPSAHDGAELAVQIGALARLAGTRPFEPHITVVGSVPGADRAHEVVHRLSTATGPFTVVLSEVIDTDEYFRCIVAVVRPAAGLSRLHRDACEAFGAPVDGFAPHVSLLYGDLPAGERERLRGHVAPKLPDEVRVDRLALVDTEGDDTRAWSTLAAWPLGGA